MPRFIYEVRVKALGYRLRLNDTVRVTYGRYGLDGGRTMRVIGLTLDGARNETILECLA
ncbi:hypothetical protein OCH7691_04603 [Oceanibacterium hippocampi]|uniref:Uncharacterized protein n=1 Tax=Oceanibacterium hippocampi TaxID=745714 RepID=A0A1Y5U0U3_9PROT|nr:hypothetical protein OCH7691_04603 [Oceanibacterium hippocampi]